MSVQNPNQPPQKVTSPLQNPNPQPQNSPSQPIRPFFRQNSVPNALPQCQNSIPQQQKETPEYPPTIITRQEQILLRC